MASRQINRTWVSKNSGSDNKQDVSQWAKSSTKQSVGVYF